MIDISLCMIVKDEENTLDNCLATVHDLVDEIIIVDTGSTDKTKTVACKYTELIYDFKWIDNFAAARNMSFSKASKNFIMWLDADDIIKPADRQKFLDLKKNLTLDVDMVIMPYILSNTGNSMAQTVISRERIIRNGKNFLWKNPIHEVIPVSGNVIYSEAAVTHTTTHNHSERNFLLLEKLVHEGKSSARFLYYYAVELAYRNEIHKAIENFETLFNLYPDSMYHLDACLALHELYLKNSQYDKAIETLRKKTETYIQYSEFCCRMGQYFKDYTNDLNESIHWFEQALTCTIPEQQPFKAVSNIYYYYIPYLQLGYCYCKNNDFLKGLYYFQKASTFQTDPELQKMIRKLTQLTGR